MRKGGNAMAFSDFSVIKAKELETNLFHNIADDWLLICTYDEENKRENLMTASWGGFGVLWGREVCFLFVRPQRHTHALLDRCERFSVSVLPSSLHDAHKICGRLSGRDTDKMAMTGLTEYRPAEGVVSVAESDYIFVVKKIYEDTLKESGMLDPSLMTNYAQKDFHTVYVCEIEKILKKKA